MSERREIAVQGIVQGVGFRPFVYGLARQHRLVGFVRNDSAGVTIELEGEPLALDSFLKTLREAPPPLAEIERIACHAIPPKGEAGFAIVDSRADDERQVAIAPDATVCTDCLRELFDRRDRRYRYPFINCTNCGPRFTIVQDVPYDRPRTTMASFQMCSDCAREYHDPANRRFHAQPNACPACGPRLNLQTPGHNVFGDDALALAVGLLKQGKILALKGLGGYHLACNGCDQDAVARLRARKQREDKPFALMLRDLRAVRRFCLIDSNEVSLLLSHEHPIVLLRRREPNPIASAVAPGQARLGVMLPYTPLHHLLLDDCRLPLVMTSGNLSDEPIAFEDWDAAARLGAVAETFLVHDRPIHMRCDDSVARVISGRPALVRRARGYAPAPIALAERFLEPVLACGAELKNTFCLVKDERAFVSHHIGDLSHYQAYKAYVEAIEHYRRLFDIRPTIVAHDLHPQYLSTQYARELGAVKRIAVQHHHAHIASCLAEHHLSGPVLGVAFDGLGYGTDGAIWGGEFLIADLAGYERVAHLRYVPLAGGDVATRQPWRSALAYLRDALADAPIDLDLPGWQTLEPKKIAIVEAMMRQGLNTVQTSSCGRLFDAVAAIVGRCHEVTYEGQAAIELEAVAFPEITESYPFEIGSAAPYELDFRPMITALVHDARERMDVGAIAARFHNTVSAAIVETCARLRRGGAPAQVCLSGGVFQNIYLMERLLPALAERGFEVFFNAQVPSNDGGIALGQAVIANEMIRRGG